MALVRSQTYFLVYKIGRNSALLNELMEAYLITDPSPSAYSVWDTELVHLLNRLFLQKSYGMGTTLHSWIKECGTERWRNVPVVTQLVAELGPWPRQSVFRVSVCVLNRETIASQNTLEIRSSLQPGCCSFGMYLMVWNKLHIPKTHLTVEWPSVPLKSLVIMYSFCPGRSFRKSRHSRIAFL